MDNDYIFLVFFTVLCQSAAGFFIFREIIIYNSVAFLNDKHLRIITLLITGLLLLAGIITASFHLGKPLQAIHTLRNLKSSWLSREILLTLIFSGIVLVYFFLELFNGAGSFRIPLSVAGILSAAGLITCMSGIYMLKSVPVWNTILTPASFVITSALAAVSLMLVILPAGSVNFMDGKNSGILIFLTMALILSLVISAFFYFDGKLSYTLLFMARIVTGLMAISVPVLIYAGIIPNKMPARLFLLLLLLSTETAGRCIFYIGYHVKGL